MSFTFDLYVPGNSRLHRLDPRVKLWAVLLGSIAAFTMPIAGQAALLLALHLLLWCNHVPGTAIRWFWRQMQWLVVLILLLQPFFTPSGAEIFALGPLHLTVGGIQTAVSLLLRAMVVAFLTVSLLFTTDQRTLIQALVRLGVPYSWGLTLSLTLRFLPAIRSLFIAVQEAQAARGWVAEGNFLRRMKEYLPVLVAVIIGTLRLSDQLTLALAARGLGTAQRTTWRDLRMRWGDWLTFAVVTLGFAGFIGARLAGFI